MTQENPPLAPDHHARRLIRAADRAVLSTSMIEPAGWPFGSLVQMACDATAAPVLLLSTLAQHTRNLAHDPRASLLIDGTAGYPDPLTGPRLTVLGRATRSEDEQLRRRYLARHPAAAQYAGFDDFHFYLFEPTHAHLVAGFGRIRSIDGADLIRPTPAAFATAEAALVETLNQDDGELPHRMALRVASDSQPGWRVTGVDVEGMDLHRDGRVLRIWFHDPVGTTQEVPTAINAVLHRHGG